MARIILLSIFLTTLSLLATAASLSKNRQIFSIPSAIQTGPSIAQFKSSSHGLDAPKLSSVNASAFDWWYFDAISTDPDNLVSVVITLFTTVHDALPFVETTDNALTADIIASFPNGTRVKADILADSATVIAEGNTSSGEWHGTGFKWSGGPLGYTITINSPLVGVKGSIHFLPVAPPHLPCGPVQAGQTLEVGPHIGWANVMPDAKVSVDLVVNGTRVAFNGIGYHDKNWSDQPFPTHVASWYWGHAHVGPYSLVWFDFLDRTGTEYVSAYLAKNGKIIMATCAADSISVRPNDGSAFPPVLSTPNPAGYHISLKQGRMEADVQLVRDLVDPTPAYGRFIGAVAARIDGKEFSGMAVCEQFKLT
ncbi:hypothetical protein R3P38DRAFT_2679231, partial [Favolaschia claudopus]